MARSLTLFMKRTVFMKRNLFMKRNDTRKTMLLDYVIAKDNVT